jgi:uncharacterized protein
MLRKIITLFFILIISSFLFGCAGNRVWRYGQIRSISTEQKAIAARLAVTPPRHISLLLPLKGSWGSVSQAIRNGFLAAYYYNKAINPDITIDIVDTSAGDFKTYYDQAVRASADIIVGPLTKQDVENLSNVGSLPIPTIALNTLDVVNNLSVNLYQFGLLPQDEAIQAAQRVLADNHKHIAIIAPEGQWGEKIAKVFASSYLEGGGQVVQQMNYAGQREMATQVCQLVANDPNVLCAKHQKGHKRNLDLSVPPRRQDIDAIFLIANPSEARQIIPLLKFYYAGDLPLYAISTIYSGTPRPNLDQDLDGVIFCDMPWVMSSQTALTPELQVIHQQVVKLWPDSYGNYSKLYALGVDSYNMAISLNELINKSGEGVGINGASGTLIIDSANHIYRKLNWAQMRQGIPDSL